jgi:hypothetical protein
MTEEQDIQDPSHDSTPLREEPATAPEESKINTETQEMEIHHHPHVHHKKKWTDYLFEFLMLFLAVTAGFLVENQREHYIEHKRSEQYATFLYNDLIKDTIHLNERIAFMATGTTKLDSLVTVLQSFTESDSSTARIYNLSAYAYSGVFYSATTSTIEQLKHSGSLRYFRSDELIRRFSVYDTDLQRLQAVEDRNAYLNEEMRKFMGQFLDLKNISRFAVNVAADSAAFTLVQPNVSAPLKLYKTDQTQLQLYANLCILKQLDWNTRINLQSRVLNSARELIGTLKKEYELGE